jgi:hypothetical protein
MKWAVVGVALSLVYPLGRWLRRMPRVRALTWTLAGILPLVPILNFGISPIYERYPAYSRGLEITFLDLILWTAYFTLPRSGRPAPYRVSRYFYLAVVLLSLLWAPSLLYATFAIWQLVRMYMMVAILSLAFERRQHVRAVFRGMMLGVFGEFTIVLWQRYIQHYYQTPGGFEHQNNLAMSINVVLPAFLALVLARRADWLPLAAFVAGGMTLLFALSRGALTIFLLATTMTFLISIVHHYSPRKFIIALIGLSVGIALFVKASGSIYSRFENPGEAAGTELRLQLIDVSAQMLRDHPLGVGINQFSLAAEIEGYAERVGTMERPAPTVHHIYWLTAAELGYPGIVGFVVLMLAPVSLAFRTGFGAPREDVRGDLALGLGTGLLFMCVHGFLEAIWRQTPGGYIFWQATSIVAALARELRERTRAGTMPRTRRKPQSPQMRGLLSESEADDSA